MTTIKPLGGRAQITRSAVLTGIAQACRVGLSFASGVVLARLLKPEDFGLIAMVSSCVAFVGLIQDLGLAQATIQRDRISRAQASALFWLSVGASILLALALAASAPFIALFFRDPRLIGLTLAFAALVVIGGAQSQQFALLNRELRFEALAGIDVLVATISAAAAIAVAWLTASYWALFVASLASALSSLICVWIVCSFRPGRPSFEGDFKEIVHFGSGVSGFNLVNYFARNADNLLIGRFYGGEQLGLYDRAYRLMLFPLQQIQAPLGRVMVPLLSRLQSDHDRYRKAYIECVSLLMIASQPGLVFVTVFADDVFLVLLGPHWLPAAPIFRWLGIAGIHQVVTSTVGWLFLSQGRGGDFFKIGLYASVTTVAAFAIGLPWGPVGVAAVYTTTDYIVRLPVIWASAGRQGPVRARDLWAASLPHAAAIFVTFAVLGGLSYIIHTPGTLLCLSLIILSYIIYISVLMLFASKREIILSNVCSMVALRIFTRL
jgi:PST family polysaccharide transporter